MSDNTCKNCKFWGKDNKGVCDRTDRSNTPDNLTFNVEATAWDDSGLESWLVTGRDFGCVLFEEKTRRKRVNA